MDLCKDALEILQETNRTFISQLVVYRQDCKKQIASSISVHARH